MPTSGEKFRALLATGRVANLPTVWSNVLVYFFICHSQADSQAPPFFLILTLTSMSLLYLGGCIMGDVVDIQFDTLHRPNRPLPNRVLSPTFCALLASSALTLGLLLSIASFPIYLALTGDDGRQILGELFKQRDWYSLFPGNTTITSLALTFCILSYAFFHKKLGKHSPLLMACCRGLLVFTVIAASLPNLVYKGPLWPGLWVLIPIATVTLYTYLLSSVAATESSPKPYSRQNFFGTLFLFLPLLSIGSYALYHALSGHFLRLVDPRYSIPLPPPSYLLLTVVILIYLGWTFSALKQLKHSKPAFVSQALAGFCLLDACIAATFSPTLALICLPLFGLSLLLQKFTPAT